MPMLQTSFNESVYNVIKQMKKNLYRMCTGTYRIIINALKNIQYQLQLYKTGSIKNLKLDQAT